MPPLLIDSPSSPESPDSLTSIDSLDHKLPIDSRFKQLDQYNHRCAQLYQEKRIDSLLRAIECLGFLHNSLKSCDSLECSSTFKDLFAGYVLNPSIYYFRVLVRLYPFAISRKANVDGTTVLDTYENIWQDLGLRAKKAYLLVEESLKGLDEGCDSSFLSA
ncbi:hypothetical protein M422DRAFT_40973 [Sphaerobolus stellatus SS14]|nr:hypothetical protein M422DRAFT_40973 [Sphaerobolus stellatus SS14]